MTRDHDTIAAPATASGGAIAVIRVSGSEALAVCDRIFRGRAPLATVAGYTVHFGRIVEHRSPVRHVSDGAAAKGSDSAPDPFQASYPARAAGPDAEKCVGSNESPIAEHGAFMEQTTDAEQRTVDEVLATVFRAPHSYTGEDSVEISCHGSAYIVSEVLRLLIAAGARMAEPGEFTVRAYLNAKMDLSQAEAVTDLIASSSKAAHALAVNQLRGGYSTALETLREQLLNLVSLIELELDFSEEAVEFADRTDLQRTMERIAAEIDTMRESFSLGNAIKQGVAVALAGAPNVGKSTLLNRLLNEQRALVSDIAGTTRDVIEETVVIDGVTFRFLDTAGIRQTDDRLEKMGIERTLESISRAQVVIRIVDAGRLGHDESMLGTGRSETHGLAVSDSTDSSAANGIGFHDTNNGSFSDFMLRDDQRLIVVVNKIDEHPNICLPLDAIGLSAKTGEGVDRLYEALRAAVGTEALYHGDAVVSNSRHYEALTAAREAIGQALDSLHARLPADLLSEELRPVIRHLGAITGRGAITPDEMLKNIFSKFCIGK